MLAEHPHEGLSNERKVISWVSDIQGGSLAYIVPIRFERVYVRIANRNGFVMPRARRRGEERRGEKVDLLTASIRAVKMMGDA